MQEQRRPLRRAAHADDLVSRVVEQEIDKVLPRERIGAENDDLACAHLSRFVHGRRCRAAAAASCRHYARLHARVPRRIGADPDRPEETRSSEWRIHFMR